MPHSSALRYRYLTSFRVILLSEFYFLTSNTNEGAEQTRSAQLRSEARPTGRAAKSWRG